MIDPHVYNVGESHLPYLDKERNDLLEEGKGGGCIGKREEQTIEEGIQKSLEGDVVD